MSSAAFSSRLTTDHNVVTLHTCYLNFPDAAMIIGSYFYILITPARHQYYLKTNLDRNVFLSSNFCLTNSFLKLYSMQGDFQIFNSAETMKVCELCLKVFT